MKPAVIDASVVVKWVIEEDGTPQALTVRASSRLLAPELPFGAHHRFG